MKAVEMKNFTPEKHMARDGTKKSRAKYALRKVGEERCE